MLIKVILIFLPLLVFCSCVSHSSIDNGKLNVPQYTELIQVNVGKHNIANNDAITQVFRFNNGLPFKPAISDRGLFVLFSHTGVVLNYPNEDFSFFNFGPALSTYGPVGAYREYLIFFIRRKNTRTLVIYNINNSDMYFIDKVKYYAIIGYNLVYETPDMIVYIDMVTKDVQWSNDLVHSIYLLRYNKDAVFIVTDYHTLYSVDKKSGTILKEVKVPYSFSMYVTDTKVVLLSKHKVTSYIVPDLHIHNVIHMSDSVAPSAAPLLKGIYHDGFSVVVNRNNQMFRIDSDTEDVIWKHDNKNIVIDQLVIYCKYLYYTDTYNLSKLDYNTGKLIWTYSSNYTNHLYGGVGPWGIITNLNNTIYFVDLRGIIYQLFTDSCK